MPKKYEKQLEYVESVNKVEKVEELRRKGFEPEVEERRSNGW